VISKPVADGAYANQRLSFAAIGKAHQRINEMPRLQTGPEKLGRPAL
jgi:hypothetical protein